MGLYNPNKRKRLEVSEMQGNVKDNELAKNF